MDNCLFVPKSTTLVWQGDRKPVLLGEMTRCYQVLHPQGLKNALIRKDFVAIGLMHDSL